MWEGRLGEARKLADRGVALTQSDPDTEWAWRLRLLLCEILLNQLELSQASTRSDRIDSEWSSI